MIESHLSHHFTRVEITISMRHYNDVYAVLDPLDTWCGQQGFPFTSRPTDVDLLTGVINILYVFEETEHATLFALTFADYPVVLKIDME